MRHHAWIIVSTLIGGLLGILIWRLTSPHDPGSIDGDVIKAYLALCGTVAAGTLGNAMAGKSEPPKAIETVSEKTQ